MKSRGLVGAVAIVLAAVATLAVFLYIQGIRQEVESGGDRVTVIIAQENIPAGSELDEIITEGAFTTSSVPEDEVVEGAVGSLAELKDQKTNTPILAGEQVSSARLQGSTDLPGGVLGIPAGHEGVSISLEGPRMLSNALQPGDRVKIFGTFRQGSSDVTVNMARDVKVLFVSRSGDESSSTPVITLAMKPQDSQELVFGMDIGTVWLALLAPDEEGVKTKPLTLGKLIRGKDNR